MSLYDLKTEAQALPESWHSRILGRVGATNLKVLRMDAHSVAEEVQEKKISVAPGQLYIAKAGIPHTVEGGSFGTLVIIDLPDSGFSGVSPAD